MMDAEEATIAAQKARQARAEQIVKQEVIDTICTNANNGLNKAEFFLYNDGGVEDVQSSIDMYLGEITALLDKMGYTCSTNRNENNDYMLNVSWNT